MIKQLGAASLAIPFLFFLFVLLLPLIFAGTAVTLVAGLYKSSRSVKLLTGELDIINKNQGKRILAVQDGTCNALSCKKTNGF